MLESKKITVVIPTHNSEKYIVECVRSAMNQTYKNIEIICVDSSDDNTILLLNELSAEDSRIRIIEDENSSYGHKLNVGIKEASGDYIAILESDDYILPDAYEIMLKDLQEDVDYIKGAVYNFAEVRGKRIFCLEERGEIEKNFDRIVNLEKERHLAFLCLPMIWAAIYRKDFLIENNIWANETPGASYQDTSFTLAVAALAKKALFKKDAGYGYRNDNQNSSVKSKSKVFCICEEYRYLDGVLKQHGAYSEDIHIRVMVQKLRSYVWNVLRLDLDKAIEFCKGINNELQEYTEEIVSKLPDMEKLYLNMLINEVELKQYSQNQAMVDSLWEDVIHILKTSRCVLIGAGAIGKNILVLQQWLDVNICAVGDNNYLELQERMNGYKVQSIESVAENYVSDVFLLASKNYSQELTKQLLDLGVSKERIVIVDKNIGKRQLFSKYIESSV